MFLYSIFICYNFPVFVFGFFLPSGVEQREGAAAEIESIILKALKELPPFSAAAIEEALDGAEMKYASMNYAFTFRGLKQPTGISLAWLLNAEITHNRVT